MPHFDKGRFEGEDVGVVESLRDRQCLRKGSLACRTLTKARRKALPLDDPVRLGSPAVLVDVEGELCGRKGSAVARSKGGGGFTIVAEQELSLDAVDRNRTRRLSLLHKVEGRVGGIEETLRVERLQVDDLEALGAADAKLRLEKVNRAGFRRNVEFLRVRMSARSP